MVEERGEEVASGERRSLWAVVLAGGEGTRLRPLVRHVCGDERPKQCSALFGARTLLRQPLDRVGLLIPPVRTVIVTVQAHARYAECDLGEKLHLDVLSQPDNRGTAAGIRLAVLEACPQMVAVSKLPGLTGCDLGSPERAVRMLTRLGISAPWLATYAA